jgi:radical SAM protein with 4Fe4S-binding SPASM domain
MSTRSYPPGYRHPQHGDGRIRFNREYFGYVAAYPEGDIRLFDHGAGPLLEQGFPLDEARDHLLPELEVRDGFHLHAPLYVWIELTRRCNLSCPHCYIEGGAARDNEMPTAEFVRLLDEMAEMGVWGVVLTGGEPTLHPDFAQLVNYARSLGFLVGVATHGMFLSEKLLDQLPRDGVIISVSMDNLHLMDQPEAEFAVASRAVLRSRKMGFLTNIMTNSNRRNVDNLDTLIGWAKQNQTSVRCVPFSPLGRGGLNPSLENTPDDVRKTAASWLKEMEWEQEYRKMSGLCAGSVFDFGLTLGYLTKRCSSGRSICYLSSDGTIYPCTSCAGEKILSPGNARGNSFAALWRSDWEIRRYSSENFRSTCEGCVINNPEYHCSSRCPATSYARHRELFQCGASEFQILSTIVRTPLLQSSPLARREAYVKMSSDRLDSSNVIDSVNRPRRSLAVIK